METIRTAGSTVKRAVQGQPTITPRILNDLPGIKPITPRTFTIKGEGDPSEKPKNPYKNERRISNETANLKKVYRMTFDMKRKGVGTFMLHSLLINPEDYTFDEPARVNVTETLGGAYVTDFGKGIPTVTLSGKTGYSVRTSAEGKQLDGFQEFVAFRDDVYRGFIEENDPSLELYWYNWEDKEYYEIQPLSFRLQRNKAEPLLYRYEFKFNCIKRITQYYAKVDDYIPGSPHITAVRNAVGAAVSNTTEFLSILKKGKA